MTAGTVVGKTRSVRMASASARSRRISLWALAFSYSRIASSNFFSFSRILAAEMRALRAYGWSERFVARRVGGRNSRLDEIQAAVLNAKLPYVEQWNARRREIAAIYRRELSGLDLVLPETAGRDHVVHMYVVRAANRDELRARLGAAGIGCDVHYPLPDYRQPALADNLGRVAPLAATERAVAEVLTLPSHPWMTDDEAAQVAAAVRTACNPREREEA